MKAEKDEKNELQNILAVTELEFPLDNKKTLDCDIQKLIYLKRSRTKKKQFSRRLFSFICECACPIFLLSSYFACVCFFLLVKEF